jgi:hypothetical protein
MAQDVIEMEQPAEPAEDAGTGTGPDAIVLNTDVRSGIELRGPGFVARDGIPTELIHEVIARLQQELVERTESLERFKNEEIETASRHLRNLLDQFVTGATVEHLGETEAHSVFLVMLPDREDAGRIADILSQATPLLDGIRSDAAGIEAGGGCIRVMTRLYTQEELSFLGLA